MGRKTVIGWSAGVAVGLLCLVFLANKDSDSPSENGVDNPVQKPDVVATHSPDHRKTEPQNAQKSKSSTPGSLSTEQEKERRRLAIAAAQAAEEKKKRERAARRKKQNKKAWLRHVKLSRLVNFVP